MNASHPRAPLLAAAIVLIFVAGLYAQALRFDYVWDDVALFLSSSALRVFQDWPTFWSAISQPILPGTTYFRPLVMASFAAEFALHGVDPYWSHATNLALLLANTALVGRLTWVLTSQRGEPGAWMVPAAAMAFYGLNPVNIEASVWVSGRFDLMVTFFALAALLADRSLHGKPRLVAVGLLTLAACLSKEMALVIPLALSALQLVHGWQQGDATPLWRRSAWRSGMAAVALAGGVYLVIRASLLAQMAHTNVSVASQLTPWTHVAYVGRSLWFYARAMAWPFSDLSPQHPLMPADLTTADVVKAAAAFALIAVLAAVTWLRRRTPAGSPTAALCLLALLSLAPVVHIIPLSIGNNIGQLRFLTLPLAFVAVAVGLAVPRWVATVASLKTLSAVAAVWVFLAITNLMITLPLWRNDVTLWTWAYQENPSSAYNQDSLVAALMKARRIDEAEALCNKVLKDRPDAISANMLVLAAEIDLQRQRPAAARTKLDLAISRIMQAPSVRATLQMTQDGSGVRNPTWLLRDAMTLMSDAYLALGEPDNALAAAQDAAQGDLPYAPALSAMANAEYLLDDWAAAEAHHRQAMALFADGQRQAAQRRRKKLLDDRCKDDAGRRALPTVCQHWQAASVTPAAPRSQ